MPLLSLLVALATVGNGFFQTWNARAIRFDAFNLDLLKLQIDASAALLADVEDHALRTQVDIDQLSNVTSNILSAFEDRLQGKNIFTKEYNQKISHWSDNLRLATDFLNSDESLKKNRPMLAYRLRLVVPGDVAEVIMSNIPDFEKLIENSRGFTSVFASTLPTLVSSDKTALSDAHTSLSQVSATLVAMQREMLKAADKWHDGVTAFKCAIDFAKANHSYITSLPKECAQKVP